MNEIERLTGIYHETQEGSLCAQHALNNLLQREIFSAISLADIAR
jgi:ataxin-3